MNCDRVTAAEIRTRPPKRIKYAVILYENCYINDARLLSSRRKCKKRICVHFLKWFCIFHVSALNGQYYGTTLFSLHADRRNVYQLFVSKPCCTSSFNCALMHLIAFSLDVSYCVCGLPQISEPSASVFISTTLIAKLHGTVTSGCPGTTGTLQVLERRAASLRV